MHERLAGEGSALGPLWVPVTGFVDLGPDYHASRTDPERRVRHHVRELLALGYTVTLDPAA